MMTTRSDSDERLAQDPKISEKASIFRDGFSRDSVKVVTLPSLEKDSVFEMSSEKQVKSSPFASVLEKDEEPINSDSVEASFSKEPEAMDVDFPGVFSVPETTSAFLEEDTIKETSDANISEVSTEGDQVGDDVHKMEEVVEKKRQEGSDVQRLLEAEKRRLLAEVETEKNGNGSKEKHQKVETVRFKDNAFVGRSVNIDLVDDTALLNVVPFSKKGKDAPRKHKKHIGGGKGKASNVVEGNQLRIVYSLNQMKSMRYAHSANQKKLWSDMYARLLPELVAEYEGLVVSLKNLKSSKSNMRESGIGPVSSLPRRNRVNIFVH